MWYKWWNARGSKRRPKWNDSERSVTTKHTVYVTGRKKLERLENAGTWFAYPSLQDLFLCNFLIGPDQTDTNEQGFGYRAHEGYVIGYQNYYMHVHEGKCATT